MKKIIIAALSCVIALSASLIAFASFDDVAVDHGNLDAIEFLADSDVVKGYEDGSFKPEFNINRAELMKILVEAQGVTPDPEQYRNCFTDVVDEWFAPYVCYAKDVEWVQGYKDGSFGPDKPVNRVESVKMTVNSQGFGDLKDTCNEKLFDDTDEDAWYGKYLCVALQKGLLEEGIDEDYSPGDDITRSQVSENIYRAVLVRKLKKEQYKEEYREMKGEALEAFKVERGLLKAEIDDFKVELTQMKEDGEDVDYIKAEREEFWGNLEKLHKGNVEDFVVELKGAHEVLKGKREQAKEKFKDCKEELQSDEAYVCVDFFEDVIDDVDNVIDDVIDDDDDFIDDTIIDEDPGTGNIDGLIDDDDDDDFFDDGIID